MKIPVARFYIKNHKAKDEVLIYLAYKLPNNSNRVIFSTKQYCYPKFWDKETRRVKNTVAYSRSSIINKELNHLAELAQNIFVKFKGNISPEDFKLEMEFETGRKERKTTDYEPMTLFRFIDEYLHNEKTKPNSKRGTWKKYETVANHLKNFAKESKNDLDFNDITWQFKSEFENWLYAPPRNHATNNVAKTFQVLSKFLTISKREGYHNNDIYADKAFKIKQVKVKTKVRLNPNEVNAVINTDFSDNPHFDKVRDLLQLVFLDFG